MTALTAVEVFALITLSFVLIALGLLLALFGIMASQGGDEARSKGLVVLLLGPIPIVLRGNAKVALLAFALSAALIIALLILLVF